MSTVKQPLKYLWSAFFRDGHMIAQPEDDRYSKHDDSAEWNPSAFRDIQDYQEKSELDMFMLTCDDDTEEVRLYLQDGTFSIGGKSFRLDDHYPGNGKLIFFREVEQQIIDGEMQEPHIVAYTVGYEYKDDKGKVQKKVITLDGRI